MVTGHLVVFIRPNGLGHPRLGVAAGRRYGKAVKRNRAKRIVREVFRTRLKRELSAVDVVVLVRSSAGELKFNDAKREMDRALKWYGASGHAN